jgi:hypothetical protein
MLVSEEEFKKDINGLVVRAQTTLTRFRVHVKHRPYIEALRDQKFQDTIFLLEQMNTLGPNAANRKHFTYKKIKAAIKAQGHGDIERFRDDLEDYFDKNRLNFFTKEVMYYLLKEDQCACARCGRESKNKAHGAWGFELDHVAENFRKEGEASTKSNSVSNIKSLKGVLLEMTQCQLTCNECHQNLTHKKTEEIAKMVF